MIRLGIVATLLIFISCVVVVARSNYLGAFNTLYGTDNKTLDTCNTCHGSSYSIRNPYGSDFDSKRLQLGDPTAALQAIELWDSDDDGDTNIVEIQANVFPGNPASNVPVEDTTWGTIKALFE